MTSAYDALAPHYRQYAARRSNYLDAIDTLVLAHLPKSSQAWLDVGAGDGVRGTSLAKRAGAQQLVLSDPSAQMAALCQSMDAERVWQASVLELPGKETFDVILCLWNVLGHLPDRESRIMALRKLSERLRPGGRLFFDVNNRHNASSYGRFRVLVRRLIDAVRPDERRGDADFVWQIDGTRVQSKGHLFTPAEIDLIISASGLARVIRHSVNYESGAISDNPFCGQLFFVLEK